MNPQITFAIVTWLGGILAWVGSGLITYGFMKAKISDFERRLDKQEADAKQYVTRSEYDNRHSDMISRLDRIEKKIDNMRS
jgi:hypothetical protein